MLISFLYLEYSGIRAPSRSSDGLDQEDQQEDIHAQRLFENPPENDSGQWIVQALLVGLWVSDFKLVFF